jgi:hypothetical protein
MVSSWCAAGPFPARDRALFHRTSPRRGTDEIARATVSPSLEGASRQGTQIKFRVDEDAE